MSICGSTRASVYFDLARAVSFDPTVLNLVAIRPGSRYKSSLIPRPSPRGREGPVRTVCACALISRHSGNSVLRTDNSVFKRTTAYCPDYNLARERKHNQYTSAEKRSHSLSSVFTNYLWNTGKSTLSRVLSPDPKLDGSLPDLTEGF